MVHSIVCSLQALGDYSEVMNFFNTTILNSTTGWAAYNSTLQQFCQYNWTTVCIAINVGHLLEYCVCMRAGKDRYYNLFNKTFEGENFHGFVDF